MVSKLGGLARDTVALKAVSALAKRKKGMKAKAVAKAVKLSSANAGKLLKKLVSARLVEKFGKRTSLVYKAAPSADMFLMLASEIESRQKQVATLEQNGLGRIEKDMKRAEARNDSEIAKLKKKTKGSIKASAVEQVGKNVKRLEELVFANQLGLEALKNRPSAKPDTARIDELVNRMLGSVNDLAVKVSTLERDMQSSIKEGDSAKLFRELEFLRERQIYIVNRIKKFEVLDLMPLMKAVEELTASVRRTQQSENVAIEFDRFRRHLMPDVRKAISSLEEDIQLTKQHMAAVQATSAERAKTMSPYIQKTQEDVAHVKGTINSLREEFKELKSDLQRGVVVIE